MEVHDRGCGNALSGDASLSGLYRDTSYWVLTWPFLCAHGEEERALYHLPIPFLRTSIPLD